LTNRRGRWRGMHAGAAVAVDEVVGDQRASGVGALRVPVLGVKVVVDDDAIAVSDGGVATATAVQKLLVVVGDVVGDDVLRAGIVVDGGQLVEADAAVAIDRPVRVQIGLVVFDGQVVGSHRADAAATAIVHDVVADDDVVVPPLPVNRPYSHRPCPVLHRRRLGHPWAIHRATPRRGR